MPEKWDIAAPATRQLEQNEEHALLRRALMAMPPDKRELLVLSRYQGMKYEQIGELLEISAAAVDMRLMRAREFLRRRLDAGEQVDRI